MNSSNSRESNSSRLKMRMPVRMSITSIITRTTTMAHSTSKSCQKRKTASAWSRSAMGMMMKLARRLAARTLVVWLETTTAPATMTTASMVVKTTIRTSTVGEMK